MGAVGSPGSCAHVGRAARVPGREMGWGRGGWAPGSGAALMPAACRPSTRRASLWSSCVVLPLLALTWMSAVLAVTDRRSALFQILFAVFDSLEGFVIVMVHCILRREVGRPGGAGARPSWAPLSGGVWMRPGRGGCDFHGP